jgi:hypothetical protein
MTYMTRALTIFVTLTALASPAIASDLRQASKDAMALCVAVNALSLEHCGTQMTGRSPEHSAARKAVLRVILLQNKFMASCKDSAALGSCVDQADWQIGAGASEVLNGPVQYPQSTAPR